MALQCTCSAYPFPHRWGGGKCDKLNAVEIVFTAALPCHECPYLHQEKEPHGELTAWCEVLDGKAEPEDCQGLSTVVKEKGE